MLTWIAGRLQLCIGNNLLGTDFCGDGSLSILNGVWSLHCNLERGQHILLDVESLRVLVLRRPNVDFPVALWGDNQADARQSNMKQNTRRLNNARYPGGSCLPMTGYPEPEGARYCSYWAPNVDSDNTNSAEPLD